jgi:hypothetical protein
MYSHFGSSFRFLFAFDILSLIEHIDGILKFMTGRPFDVVTSSDFGPFAVNSVIYRRGPVSEYVYRRFLLYCQDLHVDAFFASQLVSDPSKLGDTYEVR